MEPSYKTVYGGILEINNQLGDIYISAICS